MIRYILQRLIFVVINLLVISIVVFSLSRSLKQDTIDDLLSSQHLSIVQPDQYDKEYRQIAHSLGYDRPIFYFTIGRTSSPDTLYRIPKYQRPFAHVLIKEIGHWPSIQLFIEDLELENSNPLLLNKIKGCQSIEDIGLLAQHDTGLALRFDRLLQGKKLSNHFIPSIAWHGMNNQFHIWLSEALSGDFGLSSIDGRSVSKKITEAIQWTLILNILALTFIFGLGIVIGVWSGFTRHTRIKKLIQIFLYSFYAIPVFWLATLLIVFFTTDDYGSWTNIFASVGILNNCSSQGIVSCFFKNFQFMILPLICLILPSLAYISRQMESSILAESKKRYTLFLKSQGYSRRKIYFKYIHKNALTPMITIFGTALPALLSGSLIIEIIFNIPGIGRLLFGSIFANDWNVVFQLVIISSLLVMISYLIVDLLYKWVNPQVNLQSR